MYGSCRCATRWLGISLGMVVAAAEYIQKGRIGLSAPWKRGEKRKGDWLQWLKYFMQVVHTQGAKVRPQNGPKAQSQGRRWQRIITEENRQKNTNKMNTSDVSEALCQLSRAKIRGAGESLNKIIIVTNTYSRRQHSYWPQPYPRQIR